MKGKQKLKMKNGHEAGSSRLAPIRDWQVAVASLLPVPFVMSQMEARGARHLQKSGARGNKRRMGFYHFLSCSVKPEAQTSASGAMEYMDVEL